MSYKRGMTCISLSSRDGRRLERREGWPFITVIWVLKLRENAERGIPLSTKTGFEGQREKEHAEGGRTRGRFFQSQPGSGKRRCLVRDRGGDLIVKGKYMREVDPSEDRR